MKKIPTQNISSMAIGIGVGAGVGMLMTALVCAIVAAMVAGESVPETAMVYGAWAATVLGAISAALSGILVVKINRMLISVAAGMAYFVCLLCCTALFFGGQFHSIPVSGLLILGTSSAVGLIGIRRKEQSFHYPRKRKIRSIV